MRILSRTRLYTATISFRCRPNGRKKVFLRTENGCSRKHFGIEAFWVDRRGAIAPITAVIHTKASVGLHCAPDCKRRQFAVAIALTRCQGPQLGVMAPTPGIDTNMRHAWLTGICDSWRPSSTARMRMLRQASNIGSTTGASSLCSQMAASRRLGRVRRRLAGRSVAEERSLRQEIAGYVSGPLFYLRIRRVRRRGG